eukprot:TRINITY_DN1732_c0_g2_i6.p1 TRINITY_DN1732_c0_g2~~TRINITY_DN1732_c0_g2_i6.p1  ORF type:complete len:124 (-),score=2.84 TRINITY_DN1732_c0_g2_i6:70-441(-)
MTFIHFVNCSLLTFGPPYILYLSTTEKRSGNKNRGSSEGVKAIWLAVSILFFFASALLSLISMALFQPFYDVETFSSLNVKTNSFKFQIYTIDLFILFIFLLFFHFGITLYLSINNCLNYIIF